MIEAIVRYIIPAALSLLPEKMRATEAAALLTAIGLQESRFEHRRQLGGGPARGFWQFERGGVLGVCQHFSAGPALFEALRLLRYPLDLQAEEIHQAIYHNDVLAAVVARCLLWTDPDPLPVIDQQDKGWTIYLATWRPGKPVAKTWPAFYAEGWARQIWLTGSMCAGSPTR